MGKIQYENKVALLENADIPDINKVKADDMNEIKQVVNENAINISNEVDEDYRVNLLHSKNLFDATNVLNGMGIASGGTITSATDNGLFYIPVIAGKTYVFSFTDNGVSGNIVWGYTSQVPANGVSCTYNVMTNASLNGATFTPTGTQKYLCIRLNTTANNQYKAMSNIQIEEGSTATTYEEFVPNSIKVNGYDFTETIGIGTNIDSANRVNFVKSRNLFNLNSLKDLNNITSITKITNGVRLTNISGGNTMILVVIKDVSNDVGKTFTMKANWTGSAGIVLGLCDAYGGNRIQGAVGSTSGQSISYTIPTLGTAKYLYARLTIGQTQNDSANFTNIMLNEGNTALPYEPYITPSINVDNEEIYRKRGWNYITKTTGTTIVNVPSEAEEIFAMAELNNSVYQRFPFNIPTACLSSTMIFFNEGYTNVSGGNTYTSFIRIGLSNTQMRLEESNRNGTTETNITNVYWYYR